MKHTPSMIVFLSLLFISSCSKFDYEDPETVNGYSWVDQLEQSSSSSVLTNGSSSDSPSSSGIASSSGTSSSTPLSSSHLLSSSSEGISSEANGTSSVASSSSTPSSSSVMSSSSITLLSANRNCSYTEIETTTPVTGVLDCPGTEPTYKTVKIGDAVWMAENLNYGVWVKGMAVDDHQSNNNTVEKYCYQDDEANCPIDGGLYQWAEALNLPRACNSQYLSDCQQMITTPHQGICPTGWHIPNTLDWEALITALNASSSGAGAKMKLKTTEFPDWNSTSDPRFNDGNSSGFSAYPAAFRSSYGNFGSRGTSADFWIASENSATVGYTYKIEKETASLRSSSVFKATGLQVRCVKNP